MLNNALGCASLLGSSLHGKPQACRTVLRQSAYLLLTGIRGNKFKLRGLDIEQGPQLINVSIAVTVQRDIGRKVERSGRGLCWERLLCTHEVVVAVNQDARVLVRERSLQALNRDVGKAQVDCSFDMKSTIFCRAASIQDDRAGLSTHPDELLFG